MATNDTKSMMAIFKDLEIPHDDWTDNPAEFAKRIRDAANKLDQELKAKNSVLSMEERFKSKAAANVEANNFADQYVEKILDDIMGFDPEVMACILVRIPGISKDIAQTIRAISMRKEKAFSKRRTHLMYNRLRKAYETYVGFMKTFRPQDIGNPPLIPSRPGNYGNDSYAVTEYEFLIDGEGYLNWYYVARIIGIEIHSYMDLVEAIQNAEDGKINGFEVAVNTSIGDE